MTQPVQIYMAAVYTNSYMPGGNRWPKLNEVEQEIMHKCNDAHILESWHYVGKQSYVNNMRENNAKVFLDSGAFSAFTLGATLKVEDYVNYILTNSDIIRVEDGNLMASVLDGIGDPQETFENQMEMERLGVRPLPCFHANEDERYLEWYVKNYDYITLGGMVGASTNALMQWLDHIWDNYLTDGSGNPRIKVHGFGITAVPLMERYPWYSCDSSSWIQSASFGGLMVPDEVKGFANLSVSDKSPSLKMQGQHIENMSPIEKQHLYNLLQSQGFDPARVAEVYESRAVYNLMAYMEVERIVNERKGNLKSDMIQGLF